MSKVKFNFPRKMKPKVKEKKGVALIVKNHRNLNCLSKIIRENILYMNDKCKWIFSSKLMISFRRASKLNNYLVRPKIYAIERSVGSFKCVKKRWEVCENVNKTKKFTSSVTLKIYKINHKLNCDDKCLIYFWTCNKCYNKLQKYFAKDETTIKITRENFWEEIAVCSNICLSIFKAQDILVS